MLITLLTSEGLIAAPDTSMENASETEEKPMELSESNEELKREKRPKVPNKTTNTDVNI